MKVSVHRFVQWACATALVGLIAACGGGGGGGAAPAASVSGVAATGAAIASGTVTLKCASGTSTAVTTGTDGSFSIDVSNVTLPCVARVDYKDASGTAQKLHTFITAAGTANITPVTELLLANLTGGGAADAFDKFDATKAKALTAAQIKAAADAVKAYLKNTLGVDTTNLPDDPIGTKFTAKAGSTAGDKFDAVLDDLAAKLKAGGKKLADAENDLSKGSGGGSSGGSSGSLVVSAASNSARNGTYTPVGGKFTSPSPSTDFGYNGATAGGKFEMEVILTSAFVVKQAHIWYRDSSTVIKFFGCDSQGVPCSAVQGLGWEPLLKQVLFNNVRLSEVSTAFGASPDTLVPSGETLTVNGAIEVK